MELTAKSIVVGMKVQTNESVLKWDAKTQAWVSEDTGRIKLYLVD